LAAFVKQNLNFSASRWEALPAQLTTHIAFA